ncbi:uncharacterized protein LOC124938041 [Impatiens glandulifera]|uniref:uncharacterized protein LOC124938041 n=1 Tax=Impatiens glandulifera TaxID=253017 RepID=UPI001FB18D55|nr:uncharacterized protein LOC124938041 [Impatiens glandulifera]
MSTPESSQEHDQDFHHQPILSPKPEIHISDSPPSSASTPPHLSIPIQAEPIQSLSHPKKSTPLPWSNKETVNLILAYQEKWYSLKRGQLKANQWEEVSVTVAIHCGYDEPSKTATQCRHKIEKLRKRFKAEKQRPNPRAWEFFDFMDSLEKGPLPISARPVENYSADEGNGDDEIYEAFCNRNQSKADDLDHNVRSRKVSRFSESFSDFGNNNPNPSNLKRNRFKRFQTVSEDEEDGDDDEEEEVAEKKEENKAAWALAGEVRAFAGKFQQMENKKIEMMREIEKYKLDMETKRFDMIRQSQRRIIDTISKALATRKN